MRKYLFYTEARHQPQNAIRQVFIEDKRIKSVCKDLSSSAESSACRLPAKDFGELTEPNYKKWDEF